MMKKTMTMNRLTLVFFATLKEKAGAGRLEWELPPGATIGELRAALAQRYPALAAMLPSALAAVNHEYAFDSDPIPPEAEVAFFPPVSGG